MDLDVEFVATCWHQPLLGLAKLQLAIKHEVVLAFDINMDGLGLFQFIFATEFDSSPMAVLLPEGREHGTAFGATIVEAIAEPDFEVGGIPYPGGVLHGSYYLGLDRLDNLDDQDILD